MPAAMILTVTLNLALDVTYHAERVEWHAGNRVTGVERRAGGKGVNVARVLRALGHETVVTGFVGGATGDAARSELASARLHDALVPIAGETRRTLVVVDDERGDATGFWEPGPTVSPDEWQRFLAAFHELLPATEAVVLSGSVPSGLPGDAYAVLGRAAAEAHVPTVLDADDDALAQGLAGRPTIVKPNADELARIAPGRDPLTAAQWLRDAGADAVVASRGADGLIAVTPDGCWSARPPERVKGNPTGAGDAAVAALTAGLVTGAPWPRRLAAATAVSAAAVRSPLAGSFDEDAYRRYLATVSVEPLEAPPITQETESRHAAQTNR
jgi:tagatose 6-phosphate kinase